jgi:hypothetical protein
MQIKVTMKSESAAGMRTAGPKKAKNPLIEAARSKRMAERKEGVKKKTSAGGPGSLKGKLDNLLKQREEINEQIKAVRAAIRKKAVK